MEEKKEKVREEHEEDGRRNGGGRGKGNRQQCHSWKKEAQRCSRKEEEAVTVHGS